MESCADFENTVEMNVKMFKELWSYWASHEVNLSRENHLIPCFAW